MNCEDNIKYPKCQVKMEKAPIMTAGCILSAPPGFGCKTREGENVDGAGNAEPLFEFPEAGRIST